MSARMMKKVLKEQEAALQQQQPNSEDDSESSDSPPPARNYFDLLEDEDEDDHSSGDLGHDHQLDQKGKETIPIETSDFAIAPSTMKVGSDPIPMTNAKSKRKKKKKIGEDHSRTPSDLMLETLSLDASSSVHPPNRANKPKLANPVSNDATLKKQSNYSVLQIDSKFLSAENELRRIFGNSVVKTHERSNVSTNSRQVRGARRGNHHLKRTILVSPSQHWPRWDGSLSMELLETKDGVHYFRYIHSSSYFQAQRAFEAARATHDLNGIGSILLNHPYHIDSLLTLADYFKFTGEQQMSADVIGKCLYALECAWHPLFIPSKNCQLKYTHDTNKPLFTALFTHMKNMDRRGCHRSALEICKLLLSLDSEDPVGATLCIDYYSLRAEEYAWLEQFVEEYSSDNSLWLFPNFSFSLAVCRFYLERHEQVETDARQKGIIGKANSCDLMKQALMLHPSVLKKLVAKVPLKDRKWTTLVENKFFRSEKTGSPSLDHLIAIYVERSYLLWRLPDLQKLLLDSAVLVMDMLENEASDVKDWACVRNEVFSSENNMYSHLLVSDFSDSVPTMPPDNLQDFVVDPRVGVEHHEPIPENRLIRDVSNRNVLAVLLESVMPWVNYGPGNGDHVQRDQPGQPEQGNEGGL